MRRRSVIACYTNSTCYFIDSSQAVWTAAVYEEENQVQERFIPKLAPSYTNFVQVACGSQFAVFLRNDGQVFGYGDNKFGQLSGGETGTYLELVRVYGFSNIKKIAAGYSGHTLGLDDEGILWGCGHNDYSQLSKGYARQFSPIVVPGFPQLQDICAGRISSLGLDYDGNIWFCGQNPQVTKCFALQSSYSGTETTKLPLEQPFSMLACCGLNQSVMFSDGDSVWKCSETGLVKYEFESGVKQIFIGICEAVLDNANVLWLPGTKKFRKLKNPPWEAAEDLYATPQYIMVKDANDRLYVMRGSSRAVPIALPELNFELLKSFSEQEKNMKSARKT